MYQQFEQSEAIHLSGCKFEMPWRKVPMEDPLEDSSKCSHAGLPHQLLVLRLVDWLSVEHTGLFLAHPNKSEVENERDFYSIAKWFLQ
ncbi:MAG: hypothetical protein A2284_04830 [Deltaproteobacteria bacterium RIFOXYA12_FULL_61_11]|nr:MAG: hypothetical protein A2284_04830 [Deltaproteobacteria bacterium RIFOXYA12_FULL_61_11]